jgi:5-(aminomethyl)-3-furanmethanol phosphate kinase
MRRIDAVLKVGGSLGRGPHLAALGQEIARQGRDRRLLVVPGGGASADVVRDYYARYALGETSAHRMALLAMDQYGWLLAEMVPGALAVSDLIGASQAMTAGRVAVLLPAALLVQADPLPHSWQVTSDALAAWIAGLTQAPQLILLKDVDGLYAPPPAGGSAPARLQTDLTVAGLADQQGGVDSYLATVLAGLDIETWVINGCQPARLAELLVSGATLGTCITQHPAVNEHDRSG